MTDAAEASRVPGARSRRRLILALVLGPIGIVILLGLGTWQVQRLHWKEDLLHTIEQRMHSAPISLADAEMRFTETGDVNYVPVTVSGTFFNQGERHFFSTWEGQSGFDVYTPLRLDDGRYLLVNRGFVPYDRKDPATRPQGQVTGPVTITGLARNPLSAKPSRIIPDNEPKENIFYWKDRDTMAATAGLPAGYTLVPFLLDADKTPNPGGLPVGGVTIVNLPNNHLQYAITWYGLAAALAGVLLISLLRRLKAE
ncbi:SURF1 family protein [Manganibacter manganicus]|uniref:SURF1-like protein n=1 Tax=Manganibacter manganicus TaxID=1873176 RepID=A0A1V8RNG2_9HYPH|nr:SURF1 family protein [Pseudaminobacter manganicus]OQM74740.1 cytochrome c oxidase assembly protein [Pseudaminobacter manganicus]